MPSFLNQRLSLAHQRRSDGQKTVWSGAGQGATVPAAYILPRNRDGTTLSTTGLSNSADCATEANVANDSAYGTQRLPASVSYSTTMRRPPGFKYPRQRRSSA